MFAALKYSDARQKRIQQYVAEAERTDREATAQALRQRQAELGRRHRLQPAIRAAARHYRRLNLTAKRAWQEIEQSPYVASTGETVVVEGDKLRVEARDGTRKRMGIKFAQWQKRYWRAARITVEPGWPETANFR